MNHDHYASHSQGQNQALLREFASLLKETVNPAGTPELALALLERMESLVNLPGENRAILEDVPVEDLWAVLACLRSVDPAAQNNALEGILGRVEALLDTPAPRYGRGW